MTTSIKAAKESFFLGHQSEGSSLLSPRWCSPPLRVERPPLPIIEGGSVRIDIVATKLTRVLPNFLGDDFLPSLLHLFLCRKCWTNTSTGGLEVSKRASTSEVRTYWARTSELDSPTFAHLDTSLGVLPLLFRARSPFVNCFNSFGVIYVKDGWAEVRKRGKYKRRTHVSTCTVNRTQAEVVQGLIIYQNS